MLNVEITPIAVKYWVSEFQRVLWEKSDKIYRLRHVTWCWIYWQAINLLAGEVSAHETCPLGIFGRHSR
jgi:hypothetical protein